MTTKLEKQSSKDHLLREIGLEKGETVYTILRHVSKSGMTREICLLTLKNGVPLYLNYHASEILGLSQGKQDGLRVSGSGTDMGFHLVYSLSCALFDDGYALNHRWL